MELRVLQYFLAVARENSISGAAEFLHLSQPTLSRQLRELEEELGKQLFIRGNGRKPLSGKSHELDVAGLSTRAFPCYQRRQNGYHGSHHGERFNGSAPDYFKAGISKFRTQELFSPRTGKAEHCGYLQPAFQRLSDGGRGLGIRDLF